MDIDLKMISQLEDILNISEREKNDLFEQNNYLNMELDRISVFNKTQSENYQKMEKQFQDLLTNLEMTKEELNTKIRAESVKNNKIQSLENELFKLKEKNEEKFYLQEKELSSKLETSLDINNQLNNRYQNLIKKNEAFIKSEKIFNKEIQSLNQLIKNLEEELERSKKINKEMCEERNNLLKVLYQKMDDIKYLNKESEEEIQRLNLETKLLEKAKDQKIKLLQDQLLNGKSNLPIIAIHKEDHLEGLPLDLDTNYDNDDEISDFDKSLNNSFFEQAEFTEKEFIIPVSGQKIQKISSNLIKSKRYMMSNMSFDNKENNNDAGNTTVASPKGERISFDYNRTNESNQNGLVENQFHTKDLCRFKNDFKKDLKKYQSNKEENKNLKLINKEKESMINLLEGKKAILMAENKGLKKQLDTLNARLQLIQNDNSEREKIVASLEETVNLITEQKENLMISLSTSLTEKESLLAVVSNFEKKFEAITISETKKQQKDLELERLLDLQINAYLEKIQNLQIENSNIKQKNKRLQSDFDSVNEDNVKLNKKIEELKNSNILTNNDRRRRNTIGSLEMEKQNNEKKNFLQELKLKDEENIKLLQQILELKSELKNVIYYKGEFLENQIKELTMSNEDYQIYISDLEVININLKIQLQSYVEHSEKKMCDLKKEIKILAYRNKIYEKTINQYNEDINNSGFDT